jgi:hypothetical protein
MSRGRSSSCCTPARTVATFTEDGPETRTPRMATRRHPTGTVFLPAVAEASAIRYHHSPGGGSGPLKGTDRNVIQRK